MQLLDRADGDVVHLPVEADADDRHHRLLDLDGDRDVHGLSVLQAGNHRAVQFFAVDSNDDLVIGDIAGNDVQALAVGAVEEFAGIAAALLRDHRRHRLLEHADAAEAVKLDPGILA